MSTTFTPGRLVAPRSAEERQHSPNGVFVKNPAISGLNVAGVYAREILTSLGLPADFENRPPITLEQIESECRTFLRIASGTEVDDPKPVIEEGSWIHGGRRRGYMTNRITHLLEITQQGLQAGDTHMIIT